MKKIFLLSALLIFACSSDDEGNPCIYEPTLSTEAVTNITETSATLNGIIAFISENCDVALGEMQGFVYSTNPSPTNDDNVEVVYGTDISATIDNLIPNTTYYVRVFITNNLGEFYGNEMEFTTNEGCDVVYLDENGVTIKACDDANIGDVGTINGVDYTVVDRAMLDQMIANNEDLTVVCTTRVTDMHFMFFDNEVFNQPIDNWDVSNVTDMSNMFETAQFNQPIGNWDVSSVTNMSYMFEHYSAFNQDIGNWDVSSVTNMSHMFSSYSAFNQDIGNWDVSSVTNMWFMFHQNSAFNQPIGNWDVSSVNDMSYMFSNSAFNQDIGDWDVSSVNDMDSMFRGNTSFNQDIGNWDVGSVIDMDFMFYGNSAFNQDIGDWDVSNVTSMGVMFSNSAFNQPIGDWDVSSVTTMEGMFGLSNFNQPIGDWDVSNVTHMSGMFSENTSFNQDLSNWSVGNVTECYSFSSMTPQWTLPQPNFTNCNPN